MSVAGTRGRLLGSMIGRPWARRAYAPLVVPAVRLGPAPSRIGPAPYAAGVRLVHGTVARRRNDRESAERDAQWTGSGTRGADGDDRARVPSPDREKAASAGGAERPPSAQSAGEKPPEKNLFANYPPSLRSLALKARNFGAGKPLDDSPASIPGRISAARGTPTKEDLLRISRGFWTRMRIRFKWFTIRGFRKFNVDDLSAFFTLGGLGTAVLVIIGTTTFVSVIIAALRLLNLQEWIALQLAKHVSNMTGMSVVFQSAIVPKWKEGRIRFKDVVISRREKFVGREELHIDNPTLEHEGAVPGEVSAEPGNLPLALEDVPSFENGGNVAPPFNESEAETQQRANTNFSMFELHVDAIDVQLSLTRWLKGRGFIHAADVRGVRGIIDRRSVHWDPDKPYDPRAWRRKAKPNDFDLESFVIEDFLVTVYQPDGFRPFNFSIFNARFPQLRMQWLFYDLLNAESITGQLDGCLFSLHKPQSVWRTTTSIFDDNRDNAWQNWVCCTDCASTNAQSRLRVDGLNIDHVQKMAGLTGPLEWIYSGRFDLVADIKFPRPYTDDVDINTLITQVLDNLAGAFSSDQKRASRDEVPIPGQPELSTPAIRAPVAAVGPLAERARQEQEGLGAGAKRPSDGADAADSRMDLTMVREVAESTGVPLPSSVVIEVDIRFKDIKASMPIFTRELSYRTYAFARPVIAFMNANRTLIPVSCRIVMDLSEFDGSMDLAQTGLLPQVSEKIYEALANHVASQHANNQRVRNVSLWTLNITAQGLLRFMKTMRDEFVGNVPGMHTIPV